MRRRIVTSRSRVPREMRTFTPEHWPGDTIWRRYEAWSAAVDEYLEAHPDDVVSVKPAPDVRWDPEIDPI